MSKITEGMSDREKLIREGFCFDSDRDCEAARYLLGVIDTIRWDRKLLRDRLGMAYAITTRALAEPPDQGSGTLVEIATTLEACSDCPPLCPDSPDGNHHVAPIWRTGKMAKSPEGTLQFEEAGSDEEWMPSKAPCYYCGDKQAL